MAYLIPPLVATNSVAAIIGTSTVNLVAAPGIGKAIRLVGCQFGCNRAAGASIETELRNGANRIAMNYGLTQGAGFIGTLAPPIVEPGLQLNVNTALVLACISSAATGTAFAVVYYLIDDVN